MTINAQSILATGLAAALFAAAPAPALASDSAEHSAQAERNAFEAARQAILAMAGDFSVTFDMQESTAWQAGYEPIDRKVSTGYESVRVIEDTGTKIVLQHLLVTGSEDKPYVVKHWRQDWEYQPARILTYQGGNSWKLVDVPEDERAGNWSQTVYQVDDSPRFAGWGEWEMLNGVKRWRSNWTTRPLARRDAVRDPVYDRYVGINRHQLTPNGWIHWQDNTKMKPADDGSGALVPVVQEYVLNTYRRYDGYAVEAADAYWAKTHAYWAAIREKWDAIAAENGGIDIEQQADVGTSIAAELLTLANAIKSGEADAESASAKAVALIGDGTARSGG